MRKNLRSLFFQLGLSTLLIIALTAPSMASFSNAMKIYQDGRFEEAKISFEAMASIGDPSSLFNLGVMYFRGESVDKDPVTAYVLMKIATENALNSDFEKTAQVIFSKLTNQQKQDIDSSYKLLSQRYSLSSVNQNVFPTLLNDEDCPPELEPIRKANLVYPRSQLKSGKTGLVHSDYTISPEGYPREVNVTRATNRTFAKAAIKGIEQSLYKPTLDGMPINKRVASVFLINLKEGDRFTTESFERQLETLKEESESGDVVAQYKYADSLNTYRRFKHYFKEQRFQYREANEWYIKSAQGGLANAQFELGRNMLEGRGCEVDRENGFKWIKASAIGGYSRAQTYLATAELSGVASTSEGSHAVVNWLRNAAQGDQFNYHPKLLLAWELVASAEKSLLNPDEALELIKDKPYYFSDRIRILETEAAAYAQKNQFAKAIQLQKKAAKIAKNKEWKIAKIDERLKSYQQQQTVIGNYY